METERVVVRNDLLGSQPPRLCRLWGDFPFRRCSLVDLCCDCKCPQQVWTGHVVRYEWNVGDECHSLWLWEPGLSLSCPFLTLSLGNPLWATPFPAEWPLKAITEDFEIGMQTLCGDQHGVIGYFRSRSGSLARHYFIWLDRRRRQGLVPDFLQLVI